jgi:peptidoglycan hydrolase-like protein with peptidoglycan-binding domain
MKLRELFNRQLNEATLRRGSRGDEVKALQRALGIRPADGIFGPQTEKAVRTFQTNAGLTVDGLAGGQTQAAVRRYAEEPDASSDFGNVRPGSDWSDLDPGDIEVTPAAEPADPDADADQQGGRGDGNAELDQRRRDGNAADDDEVMSQPVEPEAGAEPATPGDATDDGGLGQRAAPAAEPDANDPRGDQTNPPPGMTRGTPLEIPDNPEDLLPPAAEPAAGPTGSGRGDGDAEVAARREEAAKQATEEFVKAQVAELTRMRRNYPEDQLIRKIQQDAVEQGLNKDWAENGAMAAYIAELVPTVDRNDAAPDVDTDGPAGFGGAVGDGNADSGGASGAADGEVDTDAPAAPGAAAQDAAPNPDTTAAVAAQISKFQKAYGSGTDGQIPTLFRDKFLNPAMETLSLKTMKELSDELAGEIPQAPARMIVQRLENAHGNMQELQQAAQEMRSDTDPEIQDQVAALDILIPLMTKLTRDAARNESVELNRIKMLAGM